MEHNVNEVTVVNDGCKFFPLEVSIKVNVRDFIYEELASGWLTAWEQLPERLQDDVCSYLNERVKSILDMAEVENSRRPNATSIQKFAEGFKDLLTDAVAYVISQQDVIYQEKRGTVVDFKLVDVNLPRGGYTLVVSEPRVAIQFDDFDALDPPTWVCMGAYGLKWGTERETVKGHKVLSTENLTAKERDLKLAELGLDKDPDPEKDTLEVKPASASDLMNAARSKNLNEKELC